MLGKEIDEIVKLRNRISKNVKSGSSADKLKDMQDDNEERFRQLFNKMPDAVIILDRKGTLLEVSEMTEKMSGYSRSEILGKNMITGLKLLDTKTKILVIKNMTLHFSGGKIQPYEIEFRRKDGRAVPLEINPQLIDYMGKKADLVVLRDITERKKAEEATRQSEQKLFQMMQGSSVAMFVIDKNHIVLYWNSACENLTGMPAKRMVGKDMPWSAFYEKKRLVMADLILEGANEAEIEKFYEGKTKKSSVLEGAYETERFFPNLGKEGKWLFFTAAPLKNEKGEIIGALETLQDITERKKAEEELRKRNEDLEKFNKLSVGRELRMIELKKRIEELESKVNNKRSD